MHEFFKVWFITFFAFAVATIMVSMLFITLPFVNPPLNIPSFLVGIVFGVTFVSVIILLNPIKE